MSYLQTALLQRLVRISVDPVRAAEAITRAQFGGHPTPLEGGIDFDAPAEIKQQQQNSEFHVNTSWPREGR
jgi:hypothetical protein